MRVKLKGTEYKETNTVEEVFQGLWKCTEKSRTSSDQVTSEQVLGNKGVLERMENLTHHKPFARLGSRYPQTKENRLGVQEADNSLTQPLSLLGSGTHEESSSRGRHEKVAW